MNSPYLPIASLKKTLLFTISLIVTEYSSRDENETAGFRKQPKIRYVSQAFHAYLLLLGLYS